jgi:cardiolipin synthase
MNDDPAHLSLSRWRTTAGRLLRLGGASDGNELTLFVDGDDAFDAMLGAIERARTRVWFETYIFAPDALGRSVLDALTRAAVRGVDVRLLVDAVGSPDLLPLTTSLTAAGGRVAVFNPTLRFSFKRRLPITMRDHRKVLVVDDAAGFCGGMNVSCDYGGARRGNGMFRDTHLLVQGPAVRDLAVVFSSSWHHACGERLSTFSPVSPRFDGSHVQVLGSDRFFRRRGIQRALHHAVTRAHGRIRLTAPYFVPPPRLLRALSQAARRGVVVEVLTAGVSDVPLVAAAARHLYGRLLKSGVQIWELGGGRKLHAKTASVDGIYAHVGSFNLDRWSFDRNLEVVAMVLDPGFSQALDRVFDDDLRTSTQATLQAWQARSVVDVVVGWCAWQLARL